MSDYQLVGHHVRVIWKEARPGGGKAETPIFRGQVLQRDETGLWLWGRFFTEKADTISLREVPREKDTDHRLYFAPWTSIDSVEIMVENTKQFETHQLVMTRTTNAPPTAAATPASTPASPKTPS